MIWFDRCRVCGKAPRAEARWAAEQAARACENSHPTQSTGGGGARDDDQSYSYQAFDLHGNDTTARESLQNASAPTLRAALEGCGLPVSGTKAQQAQRLVDAGMTRDQLEAHFGWKARLESDLGLAHSAGSESCGNVDEHIPHGWWVDRVWRWCGGAQAAGQGDT